MKKHFDTSPLFVPTDKVEKEIKELMDELSVDYDRYLARMERNQGNKYIGIWRRLLNGETVTLNATPPLFYTGIFDETVTPEMKASETSSVVRFNNGKP